MIKEIIIRRKGGIDFPPHKKIMKRESASKLFYICSAGCGILAFLFVWFCAGSSDYWTLVEQTEVPGNLDTKYVIMAAIFTLASISFLYDRQ